MNVAALKEAVRVSRWWNQARCAGMAPRFDGEYGKDIDPGAVRVCMGCPVRVMCAVDGVLHGEGMTVRGGIRLTGEKRGERQLRTWLERHHGIVLPDIHRTNPNLARPRLPLKETA